MSDSEINTRNRFYSCEYSDEETMEDFEGFTDMYVKKPMNTKANEMMNKKSLQCKRKRRTTKDSRRELLLKCYKNRSKTHGKKASKSPPPKITKFGTWKKDKGDSEMGDEEDEDDDDDEVEEVEELEFDEILLLDRNDVKDNHEGNTKRYVNAKDNVGKPDVMAEDEMKSVNHEERHPNEKKCIDCEVLYYDDKTDKTKRKCRICKCNEHGCLILTNNITSKGDTWLCGECLQLSSMVERKHPDLYENLRKKLTKKNLKRKVTRCNQNKNLVNENVDTKNKERTASNSREREKDEKRGKDGSEENLQKKNIPNPRVPLSYRDVVLSEEDLRSLNGGEWISDGIIAFWFGHLAEVVYQDNHDILFIPPSVTQALKQGLTDLFSNTIESLNIGQRKYVLMAVNNNKSDKAGGSHWSLLVYMVKDDLWLHYDSMEDLNLKEAQTLLSRMQEYINPCTMGKMCDLEISQNLLDDKTVFYI